MRKTNLLHFQIHEATKWPEFHPKSHVTIDLFTQPREAFWSQVESPRKATHFLSYVWKYSFVFRQLLVKKAGPGHSRSKSRLRRPVWASLIQAYFQHFLSKIQTWAHGDMPYLKTHIHWLREAWFHICLRSKVFCKSTWTCFSLCLINMNRHSCSR